MTENEVLHLWSKFKGNCYTPCKTHVWKTTILLCIVNSRFLLVSFSNNFDMKMDSNRPNSIYVSFAFSLQPIFKEITWLQYINNKLLFILFICNQGLCRLLRCKNKQWNEQLVSICFVSQIVLINSILRFIFFVSNIYVCIIASDAQFIWQ